jgi:hypothetical protein
MLAPPVEEVVLSPPDPLTPPEPGVEGAPPAPFIGPVGPVASLAAQPNSNAANAVAQTIPRRNVAFMANL